MANNNLNFSSFNCRSVKNSLVDVKNLCDSADFVLLQEHWLLPNELDILNHIHPDFYGTGLSAVDISSDILIGRPYGGTAILYRKKFASSVKHIDSMESRATCVQIDSDIGPVLLISVYMPTNYNDDPSLHAYVDMCSKLNAILIETDAIYTIIAGDFNCQEGSRFFVEFSEFASENNLIKSDIKRLKNIFTYISDNGQNASWLDHILCSPMLDNLITDVSVLSDFITSDHRPLMFSLSCSIKCMDVDGIYHLTSIQYASTPNWQACDNGTLVLYNEKLDFLLQSVEVPVHLYTNNDMSTGESNAAIDVFYNNIITCMQSAVNDAIPHNSNKNGNSEYNIPGWNDFVADKHDLARDAFKEWVVHGKPKNNFIFENMKKTRAVFKLALRYCKNHIEQIKADKCAKDLYNGD